MAAGRVTITDIAKLANTSTATVSHYLNDKFDKMSPATRESIRRAIEQTGYVPGVQARSLAGKPTGIIAVLILNNTNIWAGQICSGIEGVATAAGYQTVICNSPPEKEFMNIKVFVNLRHISALSEYVRSISYRH